ncbi:MAG: glycosyltransferase family 2 protein [Gammaproteobacteria bacterium]|nr:glycosyltransferase family 2 protein [Gammaproteobacteria bacterium]
MTRPALSAVVTTFNSAQTLSACLDSLAFCDELVVLDSGSTDGTAQISLDHRAKLIVQPFKGYSAQKQSAIDHAAHDWVLLLDSDEWLAADAGPRIGEALVTAQHVAYRLPRREWLFWRWQSPAARHNRYVRVFDRRHARMSGHHVHESIIAHGSVGEIDALILHRGDRDVAAKVGKANLYSSLQLQHDNGRGKPWLKTRIVLYPMFAFLRYYLLRGHFRAGWAGFIAARVHAFYAFLKYAKLLEAQRGRDQA